MQADTTPLQRFIRAAVERMPKARDHYDKLLQVKLGTKGKPIYDIDRGKSKNPSLAQLIAIAEVLEQPRELFERAIVGEDVEPVGSGTQSAHAAPSASTQRVSDEDDVAEIVALDLSLSMGPGTLIEEFVEGEPIKMSLSLIQAITRTPSDRLRLIRGIGDSMEPTLRSSDRILVDINEKQLTRISGIYWINRDGAHGIKRLRPAGPGKIAIISDNPIEDNYEVDASEIRIEGRVIWYARDL